MSKFMSERNIRFMMKDVFNLPSLTEYPYYSSHNEKVFQMIIDAALKLADKMLYPVLGEMDKNEPCLENGEVRVHPVVKKLMKAYGEGGWISAGFPESHGGDQLPVSITGITRFIFASANYSASVYPELTAGAAELITTFGTEELIEAYVPMMLEGKWQGTMALTEPQAGSSLSDITTTAYPLTNSEKGGSEESDIRKVYKIKGQKTFISAGDHDGAENIIHLMLARIDGAPAGAKGISLFVVPKKRVDEKGRLIPNDVKVAAIYHKLGYRGAPITELSMGEKDDCFGWLVGQPNRGLAQMFQMMNEARLGVGMGATAIATAAYYAALDYTLQRPQGRPITQKDPSSPQISIIEHTDVKRMLLFQKSVVEGALSLIIQCCLYADLEKVTKGEEKEKYSLLLDLLTPVAKTWPSEQGILATSQAIQCFGGYGYCDDFPVEQYFRDSRIHPIHEGTTGIQGMDLLGRKIIMKEGGAAFLFINEVKKTIQSASSVPELEFHASKLEDAVKCLEEVMVFLLQVMHKKGVDHYLADATLFLEMFGILAISWQWLIQGVAAQKALSDSAACSRKDAFFYKGKIYAMNYFFRYELPKMRAIAVRLTDGDNLTVEMEKECFTNF
ncbi:Acyl-CoA dehydrogenase family protein [Desulfamplus magnetovallimortis]|uniref:Acyl-CoA dehydrogenase family protein n=1 Tax=Desulfamplus magnetovallimortis TaxID=1246637 RepID=A0A1W1HI79_9BACT|nr:acyl-CoA dehydrogenase [Desulfamplus magnetovallimortis]SLM32156.1 Acyl-CoA dehydrogenase family protein [Desulfamplus magnetovallimortis]